MNWTRNSCSKTVARVEPTSIRNNCFHLPLLSVFILLACLVKPDGKPMNATSRGALRLALDEKVHGKTLELLGALHLETDTHEVAAAFSELNPKADNVSALRRLLHMRLRKHLGVKAQQSLSAQIIHDAVDALPALSETLRKEIADALDKAGSSQ